MEVNETGNRKLALPRGAKQNDPKKQTEEEKGKAEYSYNIFIRLGKCVHCSEHKEAFLGKTFIFMVS